MKKLIVLFLAIFLTALACPKVQAQLFESAYFLVMYGDSVQADSCPDYSAWRIISLNGKYYVCSLTDGLEAENNRLSIPVIDTLGNISPLIPENLWTRIYWDKELELKKTHTLWMEFGNWWPIMKRSTTSQRGLLVGSEIICRDIPEEIGKKLPKETRSISLILYAAGLFFGMLLVLIWKKSAQKRFPDPMMILVALFFALISLAFLTTFNWSGVIYSGLCILAGEASVITGYGWYLKKRKKEPTEE